MTAYVNIKPLSCKLIAVSALLWVVSPFYFIFISPYFAVQELTEIVFNVSAVR